MLMLRPLLLLAVAIPTLAGCNQNPQQEHDQTEQAQDTQATVDPDAPEIEPNGTVIDIYMYTVDPDDSSNLHVFKPELVSAKVGDTIRFIPTEPSHQSSSIATMLPEEARGWEGEINEEISYVLPAPGVYGYQCIPHYAAGMVGVVVVEGAEMTANLEFAMQARHPGLGNPKFVELFAEAERRGMFNAATNDGSAETLPTDTEPAKATQP